MGGGNRYNPNLTPDSITIMGYSGRVLADAAAVMDAHGIKTAKELNDKLGAVKNPRIRVFDSINRSRLLGTIPRPDVEPRGPRLMMVTTDPVSFRDEWRNTTVLDRRIQTVEFNIVEDRKGWDVELVLTTSALLSDLVKLPEFRLPGETASQAKRRWELHTFG